ncbi:MAG: lysylphosphatidylglycerol synthase domain-containing protein, partial [Nitriliruptorales bacterium]
MTDTDEDAAGRDATPRWARVARLVYLAVLAAILAWLVWANRSDLSALLATARPAWLLLALALALGQLLPSVGLWTLALRDLGHPVPVRSVLLATARSVPTRYLPGSVWYALGRAALLRQSQGVAGRSLAAVAALESALGFVVAIALGTAALAAVGRFPGQGFLLAVWFAVLAVLASPPAVN